MVADQRDDSSHGPTGEVDEPAALPVLFDVDGVILRFHPNSPTVYTDGIASAFAAFDASPSDDELASFVGDASTDRMREICTRHGLELEEFWPERERRVSALQCDLIRREERTPYDDVSVLSELALADHPIGFVSNNQQATIDFLCEHFEYDRYVDAAYGREPTWEGFERVKPSPHYVRLALEELKATTGLYVGDRLSDVVAARCAGLVPVLLRREGSETPARCDPAPKYEIETLEELPAIADRESAR